jgi:Tat protein secretion system quality control protein TatD with DNase activity
MRFYDHPKVFSTIGCHPHFARNWSKHTELLLEKVFHQNHSKLVAIGECGLDDSKK